MVDLIRSIRGAITVKENSIQEIKSSTLKLLNEILGQNKLSEAKIINIIFTITDDLNSINPATVVREDLKFQTTPMLCVHEMKTKNNLSMCIRVMLQVYTRLSKEDIKHIYLGEAATLRPDLGGKDIPAERLY